MPEFWRRSKKDDKQDSSPSEEKASESKLAGLKPMHFEPDDDAPTREDKEASRKRGSGGFPTPM